MRAQLIESEIERICSLITKDESVLRLSVFGSCVDLQNINEDSDIDICIIQKTSLNFYDRIAYWLRKLKPQVGIDIVVYTTEEYSELCKNNYFVKAEIEEKGKIIYAA